MKKKICVFCETWESGGIESFLTNVLKHIDLSKFEIDLIAKKIENSVFTPVLKKLNINFFELTGKQHTFHNMKIFSELLAKKKYDIVYLNLFHSLDLRYAFIANKFGVPCRIVHSHNSDLHQSKTKKLKLLIHSLSKKRYSKFATNLWACSNISAKFLFSNKVLKEKNYKFIPNGIDIERFRFREDVRKKIRNNLGILDSFVIGNVGRLCYQKNQIFLINLLPEILKLYSNTVLLLIGEGPDRNTLLIEAQKRGIEKNVLFLGTTSVPEQYYCAMDIFMFPSHFEGFGIAAIEAQCSGLPVLCSDKLPPEVQCSNNIKFLTIDQGVIPWLSALEKIEYFDRNFGAQQISAKGFDIQSVSSLIEEEWSI